MKTYDLILLHAPSVYDFRQKTILYGPVSDLVPPSHVFEMYPIGFASIAEYLEKSGFRVRIVNLAVRMLRDKNFDAEQMIRKLNSPVFGIDLHWMVHCHGSIEVARLVKKHHPEAKVLFGGYSSSYYYRELMQYPEIDFILRGDSTEEPLRQLMDCIKKDRRPEAVPNLVWRDADGSVRENPLSNVPAVLDNVMVDHYSNVVRSVIRDADLSSYLPIRDWLRYPVTAVLTCRGCSENCVICGGSGAASRRFYQRNKPAFHPPGMLVENVKQIARFSNGPIFILGDLRQAGDDYADAVFNLLEKARVKNRFFLELWTPASRQFLEKMARACPDFCLEISPESHDYRIRKLIGRDYTNDALEQSISDALDVGCSRLDIFFMMGLSGQSEQSALDSVDYCDYLLQRAKSDKRLSLFTAPLAPFLDPGSLGFEQPEKHGYRLLFRTLAEHRRAIASPSWKYSLNYETELMTRDRIAEVSYEAILRLNQVKARHGVIDQRLAAQSRQRLEAGRNMMHRLDGIINQPGFEEKLLELKPEIDRLNWLPVSEKRQLELPVGLVKLKPLHALWDYITRR